MILEEREGMAKNVVKLTGGKSERIMIIVCDTDFLSSFLKGHVATMKRQGITNIATNDPDFERVEWLKVWKP